MHLTSSPTKEKNRKYRLCIDCRRLNGQTICDSYPISDFKALLNIVSGSKVYSTVVKILILGHPG